MEASETLHIELLLRGLLPVTTTSGGLAESGEQKRHLFARIADPEIKEHFAARAKELGGDVRHDIRPPWARHRAGTRSIPLYPTDPHDVNRRLNASGAPFEPWTEKLWSIIFEEILPWKQRSGGLRDLTKELVRRGWSRDEALLLMQADGYAVSSTHADAVDQRGGKANWYGEQIWDRYVDERRPARVEQVRRVRTCVFEQILNRKADRASRMTDIRVIEVFLQMTEALGRWEICMSHRELAERAGVAWGMTVNKALKRLRAMGVLRRVVGAELPELEREHGRAGATSKGHWYRITVAGIDVARYTETSRLEFMLTDVFRNQVGLNASAGWVFEILVRARQPMALREVVEHSRLGRATASRALKALVDAGLVGKVAGSYEAIEDAFRSELIPAASEAASRVRARHALQRRGYEDYMRTSAPPSRRGKVIILRREK